MNLNAENLNVGLAIDPETKEPAVSVEPQYLDYLRGHDYRLKSINEVHVVESSSDSDSGHVVMNVTVYDKPTTESDFLDHDVELWCCDCGNYRYECSADVSKPEVKPSDSGTCKHVQSVSKVQRAKSDSNQDTLV